MLKKQILVATILVVITLPAGADTVTGSVSDNLKAWAFEPPAIGGQAIVTASWKQKSKTALVLLVCEAGDEELLFGASANLNANRTARIEAGVLGDLCVVGIQGFGGKVTFRLNVQVASPEGLRRESRPDGEASSAAINLGPGALVRVDPGQFSALAEKMDQLRSLLLASR